MNTSREVKQNFQRLATADIYPGYFETDYEISMRSGSESKLLLESKVNE